MLAKHTKSFNVIDTLSVASGQNFEPLQRQVELWKKTQITYDTAKLIFYSAFVDGQLEALRNLLPEGHRLYFERQYREFAARTYVESVECLHQRLQEARSGAAVQSDGEVGEPFWQTCRSRLSTKAVQSSCNFGRGLPGCDTASPDLTGNFL